MPDLEGSLSNVLIGSFTVESIDGHKRGVGAASLQHLRPTFNIISSWKVTLPRWVYVVMSTPSLNAEKRLLLTMLLYCRRTLPHLNPLRGNPILSPRIYNSTFTGLFLYCPVLFVAHYSVTTTDVRPVLLVASFAMSCSYWSIYVFECNHVMACLFSSASTVHSVSLPFVANCIRGTVCLSVHFSVFRLSAHRNIMIPQLSLSIVLA